MLDMLSKELTAEQVQYVSYALTIRPDKAQELIDMSGIYSNDDNLRILADQIGDIIAPFMTSEQLERIAPEDRLEGLAPAERIEGLDVEGLEALANAINEQMRWHLVHQADSAATRIAIINEMSQSDRTTLLVPDNRERLLERLNAAEQAQLIAWIEE